MRDILQKHSVKLPNDVTLIYVSKKKIITFMSSICKKSLKLNTQFFINKSQKIIKISGLPFTNVSNSQRKKLKAFQGTNLALLKQHLIEISIALYQKLKFVGVGYRVFTVNDFKNKLLLFKLGYSHFLYFKILKSLEILNFKMLKLFIFGHSYKNISKLVSQIRSYKKPEPYKGKGILYATEKVTLKKGKKI